MDNDKLTQRVTTKSLISVLSITICVAYLYSSPANTAEPAPPWKQECVGLYSISFPTPVEYALVRKETLTGLGTIDGEHSFSDGRDAIFSLFTIQNEPLRVTHPQPRSALDELEKAIDNRTQLLRSTQQQSVAPSKMRLPDAVALAYQNGATLYLWQSDHITEYVFHANTRPTHEAIKQAVDSFHGRAIFDIPTKQGLCIPYGFFETSAARPRSIAITVRLKDHPDVEIHFKDESLTKPRRTSNGKIIENSARDEIRQFFDWNYYPYAPKAEADWRGFRSIKIDGREGKAIFVTLTRPNGETDYGYVAYVKGDYSATEDSPNLMLYVIRTAAHAKGTPVSKDELLSMAEQIAASIKRRPTR